MLPSGLPDIVADGENLIRFLTQSSHFNLTGAKPSAFLPAPRSRDTSVFRMATSEEAVRKVWAEVAAGSDRSLHGFASFTAKDVRAASLDVIAAEPPDAHANVVNWPWINDDPELQKARQKEKAMEIASKAKVKTF